MRTFGGNSRAPYEPATVDPTNNFYHALQPLKTQLKVEGNHLSFTMPFELINQRLQVTINLRRYSSCICASVKTQSFRVKNLNAVFTLQNLEQHKNLFILISEILAMATSGSTRIKQLPGPPKTFPIIQIMDSAPQAESTLHTLVEILTRHPIDEREIVESVIGKNKPHKIDNTLVLIDKQGILSYLPSGCTHYQIEGNLQRFQNASSLLEFAYAIRSDIRAGSISRHPGDQVINDSKYFLPDSISSQRMWDLLVKEFSIQHELKQEVKLATTASNIPASTSLPTQDTKVIVQQFFSTEVSMGDQYNITGQAGAIGPNSKAENNIFNQVLQHAVSSLDLPALTGELATLRKSMREQATEVEHDQAVAHIGAAELAAKQQDGAGALEHLKSAGKWALDVATTIGTTVAAQAIQTAAGL